MNVAETRAIFAVVAALAVAALGCDAPAEIVIVVDAQPDLALEHVRITAQTSGDSTTVELEPRSAGAVARPWTLGLSASAGAELFARVTGTLEDGRVVEASARTRFVAGERRVLYLYLAAACLDVRCPAPMTTCEFASGTCVADDRPTCPFSEPLAQGPPPDCTAPPPDAGIEGGLPDATQDGGVALPRPTLCSSGICAISAGARHACALRSDGDVLCWGGNDHGELGNLAGPGGAAARVDGVGGAIEVAAGGGFTCALTADDRIACWGDNRRSQLGSDVDAFSATPRVFATPASAPPVAIRAGDAFACALHADRTVFCWGDNTQGQLATELTTQRSAPRRIALPFAAEGLTTGGAHACAWGQGRVMCWGSNASQQVDGTSDDIKQAEVVISGAPIESLAAGRAHTCAIVRESEAQTVYCWGDNSFGQSGGGGRVAPTPQRIEVAEPRALTAGGGHTCALVEGGERVCWGHNAGGALAVLASEDIVQAPSEGSPAGVWQQLSAGGDYTCGVGEDGVGRCWGWDLAGAAGRGATLTWRTPQLALGGTSISGLALGAAHSCAIRDESLRCWGGNALRQLGSGDGAPASTGADVATTMVSSVTAGASHTCFIAGPTLAVRCFGANHAGQSAQPLTTTVVALPPTDPLLTMLGSLTAGAEHTCVYQNESGVLCWGRGDFGQLGTGVRETPTPVPAAVVGSLSAPSAGGAHTCALGADSYPECWGANDRGQLGRPASPEPQPARVRAFLDPADGVASGGRFSCAWNQIAGHVWCVGADDDGQLGNDQPLVDSSVPVELVAPAVRGVTAGARHACWWSDAEVFCWGANDRGQAGASAEPRLASPEVVTIDGSLGIVAVAAGEAHTCAAVSAGSIGQQVWCWGSDEDGRLGSGRVLVFATPESVVGL